MLPVACVVRIHALKVSPLCGYSAESFSTRAQFPPLNRNAYIPLDEELLIASWL
jgi:hypothetical protein